MFCIEPDHRPMSIPCQPPKNFQVTESGPSSCGAGSDAGESGVVIGGVSRRSVTGDLFRRRPVPYGTQ